MSAIPVLGAVLVACLGAVVQGSVGMGGNLVAAPLLLLIDPRFVPVPLLVATVARSSLVARRDRHSIGWDGVSLLSAGRVPGTVAAVLLLGVLPRRGFTVVFEVLIIVAVVLSIRSPVPRRSRHVLVATGMATGFMATLTSVGGGLTGLLFRDVDAQTLRGTVASAGAIGGTISLVALALLGRVHGLQLLLGVILLPSVVGVPLSSSVARRIGVRTLRPIVLGVVALSALSGLARVLLG